MAIGRQAHELGAARETPPSTTSYALSYALFVSSGKNAARSRVPATQPAPNEPQSAPKALAGRRTRPNHQPTNGAGGTGRPRYAVSCALRPELLRQRLRSVLHRPWRHRCSAPTPRQGHHHQGTGRGRLQPPSYRLCSPVRPPNGWPDALPGCSARLCSAASPLLLLRPVHQAVAHERAVPRPQAVDDDRDMRRDLLGGRQWLGEPRAGLPSARPGRPPRQPQICSELFPTLCSAIRFATCGPSRSHFSCCLYVLCVQAMLELYGGDVVRAG